MISACELAVNLSMIEPPCKSVDGELAEVMARLPPTDYLFAKRTLEAIDGITNPKHADNLKRCLCGALWGNPLAMGVLQLHFLKLSVAVAHPPDDLFAYWTERRKASGFAELCRMNVVDKMELVARAYCNNDAEPRHGEKRRWRHVAAVIKQLESWGFNKEKDPHVLAVGYGHILFSETKMTPLKLGAFAETGEEIDEMARVVNMIELCDRAVRVEFEMPEEVLAVRSADVICEERQCRANAEEGEAEAIIANSMRLFDVARTKASDRSPTWCETLSAYL